jgi:two-component system, NtrC family, response regulator GlrR
LSESRPLVAVINDDPAFLELLSTFLTEDCNWRVVVWADGIDAVSKLRAHRPDVVILDIRLEDHDSGRAILAEIRRDTSLRAIPVIVCTADSQFLREHSGLLSELGADVLEKPFDLDTLESKVEQALAACDTSATADLLSD